MLTLHSHSMIPVSYWEVADRRATRKQHQTFQQRKERTKNRVQQEDTHHLCCVSDEKCSTESRRNASLVFPTKTAQELRVLGRRMRFLVTSRGVRGPRRSSVMGSISQHGQQTLALCWSLEQGPIILQHGRLPERNWRSWQGSNGGIGRRCNRTNTRSQV